MMNREVLNKFLNNGCTAEELEAIIHWLKNEALNFEGTQWGLQEWKSLEQDEDLLDKEEFNLLLDKIHHKINLNRNKHEKGKTKTFKLNAITTWLTRAAAILLLPVLVFLFYIMDLKSFENIGLSDLAVDSIEIVSPIGSKTIVNLSDGSLVYLNHGSKLKYPQKFNAKSREVLLIGEGYFKVAHNPEVPFIVKTSQMDIKALGTEFNVLAYPDDDIVETTLVNGKVIVDEKDNNGNIRYSQSMEPNQHISYNLNTGRISISNGDVDRYISWKEGKLIFINESIVQITERLSRWYNVDFEFEDEDIKNYTFTVTFDNETLNQVLEYVKIATPIEYETIPRQKLQDGSLSTQVIILQKKSN